MAELIDARSLLLGAVCGAAVVAVWLWLRASLLCVWLPQALAPGQLGSDYMAACLVLLLGWPTGMMLRDAVGLRSGLYVLLALLLISSLVLGFTDIRAPHPRLGVWFKLTIGWLGVASLSLVGGATQITQIEAPAPAAGAWRWVALCLLMLLPLGTALIMLRPISRAWLRLEPHVAQSPCATGEASTGRSVADADGNDRAGALRHSTAVGTPRLPSEPPQIGEPAPAAVPRPTRRSFIDRLLGRATGAAGGTDAPGSQVSFFGDFMREGIVVPAVSGTDDADDDDASEAAPLESGVGAGTIYRTAPGAMSLMAATLAGRGTANPADRREGARMATAAPRAAAPEAPPSLAPPAARSPLPFSPLPPLPPPSPPHVPSSAPLAPRVFYGPPVFYVPPPAAARAASPAGPRVASPAAPQTTTTCAVVQSPVQSPDRQPPRAVPRVSKQVSFSLAVETDAEGAMTAATVAATEAVRLVVARREAEAAAWRVAEEEARSEAAMAAQREVEAAEALRQAEKVARRGAGAVAARQEAEAEAKARRKAAEAAVRLAAEEAAVAPGAEAAARWEAGERAARAAAEERGRREAEESVRKEAARREAAEAGRGKAEETAKREAEEEAAKAAKAAAPRTPPPWLPAAEAFDGRSPYVGILASEVKEVEELRAMLAVPRSSSSRTSPAASPATCRASARTHNPPPSAATLSTALSPGACQSAARAAADRSVRAADSLPIGLPWRVGEGVYY